LIYYAMMALPTMAQIVNIPDSNFKAALISEGVDLNNDGEIQVTEAQLIDSLFIRNRNIFDLTGIEAFTSLRKLYCEYNNLTIIDIGSNAALTHLYCTGNQISILDVSKNSSLKVLDCPANPLKNLDVSKNSALEILYCAESQIENLNVSGCIALTDLYCSVNKLEYLDVSANALLTHLFCENNQLETLDASSNPALKYLYCGVNKITILNAGNNVYLRELSCNNNLIASLDVRGDSMLSYLNCMDNPNLSEICVTYQQYAASMAPETEQFWNKDFNASWSLDCSNSIADINKKNIVPELLHIYNIAGQEVNGPDIKDGIYIFQNSDGSVRKICKISNHVQKIK